MAVGVYMWMNGRLSPVCHHELDGGRRDRVLRVESELKGVDLRLVQRLSHNFNGEPPCSKVVSLDQIDADRAALRFDLR